MKQLKYYMMMLSALLCLWSCSDDDEPANAGAALRISLSADVLQVSKAGGTAEVTVTSDADWRLAGVCDWVTPSITEGRSGDKVTFTIDANTTGKDLSTTFKFFTGASVAPLVIESVQGYGLTLASADQLDVTQPGGEVAIRLNSNVQDLTLTFSDGGEQWVSLNEQVEFGGNQILRLNIAPNEAFLGRSTVVTVSSELTEETVDVLINQDKVVKFELTHADMEDMMLSCDMAAQTVEMTLVTNQEFTPEITSGEDWITGLQVTETDRADNGLNTYAVTFDLAAAETARLGSLVFNVEDNTTWTVTILQNDPNAPVASISSDFADELVDMGWIMPLGEYYVVLQKGLEATELELTSYVTTLSGIENFPNLEKLSFYVSSWSFYELDISGLHNVKEVSIVNPAYYLETINLGDNPITSFSVESVYTSSCYAYYLTIISTKLETLECPYVGYSNVRTLDVSQCPALKTMTVADDYSYDLTTIVVKEGQTIDITKPDDVAIEYR